MKPNCPLCGAAMKKSTRNNRGTASKFAGGVFGLVGALLTATCVGAVVGIPLMVYGSLKSKDDQKIWLCRKCRHVLERG